MNRRIDHERSASLSWVGMASAAAGLLIALGCATGGEEPIDPGCVPGEMIPAEDGCNTCTCLEDGTQACTEIACAPTCVPGETFAVDCNTCTCLEDGTQACTEIACGPADGELGGGCSLYGAQCEQGLECEYQCPNPNDDPSQCNLGINPAGVCIDAGSECFSDADCVVSGCSGQICAPIAISSDCGWLEEYACYGAPVSTCQCSSGVCGWSPQQAIDQCIQDLHTGVTPL